MQIVVQSYTNGQNTILVFARGYLTVHNLTDVFITLL